MAAGVMRWPSDVTLFFRENGIALEKAQRQHREGHGRSLNPTPVGSATRNRVPQSGSAIGFRNQLQSNRLSITKSVLFRSLHFQVPSDQVQAFPKDFTINNSFNTGRFFAMLRHASPYLGILQLETEE